MTAKPTVQAVACAAIVAALATTAIAAAQFRTTNEQARGQATVLTQPAHTKVIGQPPPPGPAVQPAPAATPATRPSDASALAPAPEAPADGQPSPSGSGDRVSTVLSMLFWVVVVFALIGVGQLFFRRPGRA